MRYRFGEFEFDTRALELLRDGQPVDAPNSAMEMLRLLLENAGRTVAKQELIDGLWDGRAISDDAIAKRVSLLRKALGEGGRDSIFIRSVYGKGVRFRGEVEAAGDAQTTAPPAAPVTTRSEEAETTRPAIPERPSIAVLPFRLTGIAGPHASIAEGLPDEIIASLSRLRWLFVISRGSSFRFLSFNHDPAELKAALGVRYALSGSVEIRQGSASVFLELSDLDSHELVWSERLSGDIAQVQELREEIVMQVASKVEAEIPLHEARQAQYRPIESLSAWENFHLGFSKLFALRNVDLEAARTHLSRAITQQPDFARAHGALAHAHWSAILQRPKENLAAFKVPMMQALGQALQHDARDPLVQTTEGRILYLSGEAHGAIKAFEEASIRSPSYSQAFAALGGIHSLGGDADQGIAANEKALALSPLDPNFDSVVGAQICALLRKGEVQAAAEWADRVRDPTRLQLQVRAASLTAYDMAGRQREAANAAAALAKAHAGVGASDILGLLPFLAQDLREFMTEAFQNYGLKN